MEWKSWRISQWRSRIAPCSWDFVCGRYRVLAWFLLTFWRLYSRFLVFAEGEPYDAERHLALGTKDSAEQLAKVEYEWYTQDESHTAALYAARAVFPYLLTSNLRSANKAYLIFTSRLSSSNKSLSVQEVSSTSSDLRVYPSLPLLNFLGLLLLAVQRGSSDLYKQLAKHYAPYVKEVGTWDDALAQLGEMYFGIRIPRPGNPLMVCTFSERRSPSWDPLRVEGKGSKDLFELCPSLVCQRTNADLNNRILWGQ